jgi:phenylacetate-CoA ligase
MGCGRKPESAFDAPSPSRPPAPSSPELLSRPELEALQLRRLQSLLREIVPRNRFWTERLHVAPDDIRTLSDVRKLPLSSKADFVADQAANPPYGTNLTFDCVEYTRLHQSSGTSTGQPLRWLDTPASWQWMLDCWTTKFRLVGVRREDRFGLLFSFGPFLGFWAAFEGALQQGWFCIAAGGLGSEARLRLLLENEIHIVGCTPTYALRLAEVAQAKGIDLAASSVHSLIVAGEPGGNIAATRQRIEELWGARVIDHWGMTEVGPLATECPETPGSLTVLESECLPEIVDPATTEPTPPGDVGELVITNFGRSGSPAIRYRTGDLVRAATTPDLSGRCWLRLEGGILGRADDMLIVRGNNVFPSSIEAVVREFREVVEFRIVVSQVRSMTHLRLEIEPEPTASSAELARRIAIAVKDRLNFQVDVTPVAPGTLPRFEMKAHRVVRE